MSTRMQDVIARGRSDLRHEPIAQRVRAALGPDTVVDSTRAVLVWEPRRIAPSYAVPVEDIKAELSAAPAANGDVAGMLHPGIPFEVHTAGGDPVRFYLPREDVCVELQRSSLRRDEIVDVVLDGERRARPGGVFAEVLRDEFDVR